MKQFLHRARHQCVYIWIGVLFLSLKGCSASDSHDREAKGGYRSIQGHTNEAVRIVDASEVPKLKGLCEQARRFGNEMYPKIVALFSDGSSTLPQQFDIVFKQQVDKADHGGMAIGTRIYLNGSELIKNPGNLEVLLIHEMAHVAQAYKWYRWRKIPMFWKEGIAAYVQYKLGYRDGRYCPQCSIEYPHYTSGYWCAGAFLLYLDTVHGSNIVRELNTSLRQGTYRLAFFSEMTGKSLEALWAEFQKTAAYTPLAAEANVLSLAFGKLAGRKPEDLQSRYEAYAKARPGGNFTIEARSVLIDLMIKGQQPGWSIGEPGQMSFGVLEGQVNEDYPIFRTFHGQKHGDSSVFHYSLSCASRRHSWKLVRAWRTDVEGNTINEFPIPQEKDRVGREPGVGEVKP